MGRREIIIAILGLIFGATLFIIFLSPRIIDREPDSSSSSAWQPITITFNRPISIDSNAVPLKISPAAEGTINVVDNQIVFHPSKPLNYGQSYSVEIGPGLQSSNGLPIIGPSQWSFQVQTPQLIFLRDTDGITNLWKRDADGTERQLTHETSGVWDYVVNPQGNDLIYSAFDDDGSLDLILFSSDDRSQLLLDCQDNLCRAGHQQPGGNLIAFERQALSDPLGQSEVWLFDRDDGNLKPAYDSINLVKAGFPSSISHSPRWSADGRYLAYFKPDARVIVVDDMAGGAEKIIPANLEIMGDWSQKKSQLAYTEITLGQVGKDEREDQLGTVISHTQTSLFIHVIVTDLEQGQTTDLSEGLEVDDGQPSWHPHGEMLASTRSSNGSGRQLWLLPLDGRESEVLTDDPFTQHTAPIWSPDGRNIAFMKRGIAAGEEPPSIWILDSDSGQMELAVSDAFLPGWLP